MHPTDHMSTAGPQDYASSSLQTASYRVFTEQLRSSVPSRYNVFRQLLGVLLNATSQSKITQLGGGGRSGDADIQPDHSSSSQGCCLASDRGAKRASIKETSSSFHEIKIYPHHEETSVNEGFDTKSTDCDRPSVAIGFYVVIVPYLWRHDDAVQVALE